MVTYTVKRFRVELEQVYGKDKIPDRERDALQRWEELFNGSPSDAARDEIWNIITTVAKPWADAHPMIRFDVDLSDK